MISKPLGRPRREPLCRSRRTPPRGLEKPQWSRKNKHVTVIGHHHTALFELMRGHNARCIVRAFILIDECQQFSGENTFLGPNTLHLHNRSFWKSEIFLLWFVFINFSLCSVFKDIFCILPLKLKIRLKTGGRRQREWWGWSGAKVPGWSWTQATVKRTQPSHTWRTCFTK